MNDAPDQVAVIAVHAGQVLLVRTRGDWQLPRRPAHGGAEETLDAIAAEFGLVVQGQALLGREIVGDTAYDVYRLAITGLPAAPGLEVRLVRLAQLPKEFGTPDRELLDLLLAG